MKVGRETKSFASHCIKLIMHPTHDLTMFEIWCYLLRGQDNGDLVVAWKIYWAVLLINLTK